MKQKEEQASTACKKCGGKFSKAFSTISGNSKYFTWQCDGCGYRETKCTGVLN